MYEYLRSFLFLSILTILILLFGPFELSSQQSSNEWLKWSELPSIPDSLGLGGAIIGESNGVIVVAGGSNFEKPIWEDGQKRFRRDIFILQKNGVDQYEWKKAGVLPFPVSNGASVTTSEGIISLGGVNAKGHLSKVLLLKWNDERKKIEIDTSSFPDLPEKCSYLSATILKDQIFVAGGKNELHPEGMKNFWTLDLSRRSQNNFIWKSLPAWEGNARYGTVLASQNNGYNDCLYLISGKKGSNEYLKDVFQFNPVAKDSETRWIRKSNIPRAAMVASSAPIGQTHILVFSGSDGHDIDKIMDLKDQYQFVRDILTYHTITDTWIEVGNMPVGMVTSQVIKWDNGWIIPGGEISPGRRTNKVFLARAGKIADKSAFHWIDFVTLGAYLLFITLFGVYFSREKDKGTKSYFLGGGKIPYWAAALSIMATSISSIGFMATPSKSFATNWAYFAGTLTMFVVIPIVVFAFIPFFHRLKVVSAYEYLEARFNVVIRLFAAVTYCVFQIAARMSIVLYLPGIALAAVTGMDVYLAILLMGILSTVYTVLGGMKAVIWTDVVQGFVLVGGALLCIIIAVFSLGSSPIPYIEEAFVSQKFKIGDITDWDYATASLWVVVFGNIFYRLSTYTSDQSIVQRYMVTSDVKKAQRASWTSLALLVPWSLIVFTLGTVLFIFYKEHPIKLNPLVNTDGILPLFIAQSMPIGLSGLIIAAIFAAAMSSLDSAMHSTSTVIVTDFYNRFSPTSTEQSQLRLAKWLIAVFGIFGTAISMWMVTQNHISIWDVFLEFTGLFGGITAGLFFLGIFTTKGNASGALVGIIGSIIILVYVKTATNIHLLLYGAVSLLACFILGYLFSWILPGKAKVSGLTVFTRKDNFFTNGEGV